MSLVEFHGVKINITPEKTLSTEDVAKGYGVDVSTIRRHKKDHSDELIEGVHYINEISQRGTKKLMWTLEGVHMLGFFIKSERAKEFRKFTAKLLTEIKQGKVKTAKAEDTEFLKTFIYNLERENIELKRAINRITYNQEHILLEQNLLDLAGSLAREQEELTFFAEQLEQISKELKERSEKTKFWIDNIAKYAPNAKSVAEDARKITKKDIAWKKYLVKQSRKERK